MEKKRTGSTTTRGADEGTRTHTLMHENLNLACLPIPSHLRVYLHNQTSSAYSNFTLLCA